MDDRRIVIHAGLPKTGTSALQVAFVRNREALERAGVRYPVAATDADALQGRITTGNAGDLRSFATKPDGATLATVTAQLQAALDHDRPVTLISSELLYTARRGRLAQIRDVVREAGAELELALCVRNILPWAMSYYGQRIKRHAFTGSVSDFLDEFAVEVERIRPRLEIFIEEVGRDRMRVLHYESHRGDLVGAFLTRAVGVQVDQLEQPGTVNRALTSHELEWMRQVNRQVAHERAAWQISDALVHHPRLTDESSLLVAAEDVERLHALADDQVAWVNEQFFDGEPVLAVEDPSIEVGDPVSVSATAPEQRLLEVASGLADRLVGDRVADMAKMAELRRDNAQLRRALGAESRKLAAAQRRVERQRERLQQRSAPPPRRSVPRALLARGRRLLRRRQDGSSVL